MGLGGVRVSVRVAAPDSELHAKRRGESGGGVLSGVRVRVRVKVRVWEGSG